MAADRLPELRAEPPPSGAQAPDLTLGTLLASRFEVRRRLGAGAMGQVYGVYDQERRSEVALKLLGRLTPHTIAELKAEFRAASELVHPNLVRLHELFCEGAVWFFTMDLVEGETLPELQQRVGNDPHVVRDVFTQLAQGLTALHRSGVIHRDLKPSNFLITREQRRVLLLDFGLAQPIGQPGKTEIAGTPAYMAPEQYWGEALTEAADWYGFGVVLYEALVGTLPNRVPSREQLAKAPRDLANLCVELMNLDVARRPTGEEVLARLNATSDKGTGSLSGGLPQATALIGRRRELERLNAAFESMLQGQTALVLVAGPSGIGKTALVEHFVQRVRAQGALVLESRCRERESMSYKAVDGLIDDIASLLDELPQTEVEQLLPKGMAQLALLFPILRTVRALRHDSSPPPHFEHTDRSVLRAQAVEAFAELVTALRRRSPLLLWIDDLQWSDTESALLLEPLLVRSSRIPITLIASFRGEPNGDGGPLLTALRRGPRSNLPHVVEVALQALPPREAEMLARTMLPGESARLARQIAEEAAGHPLFVQELAFLKASPDLDDDEARHSFTGMVDRRLVMLSDPAREVLKLTALAGGPTSRTTLRQVQSLAPNEMEAALDVLRAARLARSEGLRDENLVEVYHDRVREIVLRGLSESTRQRRHLALANALQTEPSTKPEQLAHHYEGAKQLELASSNYVKGADAAVDGLAFAHAAELYERALALIPTGAQDRAAVELRRARALSYAGMGPAAAEAYLALSERADGDDRIELLWRAAEQLLYSGHVEKGFLLIEEVCGALGTSPPRLHGTALLTMLLGRVRVRLRGLRYQNRDRAVPLTPRQQLHLEVAWTASCALTLIDPISGGRSHSEHMLRALEYGDDLHLLRALTLEATYAATPGGNPTKRVKQLTALARQLAESLQTEAARGLFELTQTLIYYLQNDNEASVEHADRAIEHFSRAKGAFWENITAQRFAISARFFLGRFRELGNFVPPLIEAYEGTGNRYATMCFRSAFSTVAWLIRDEPDEARRQLQHAAQECETGHYDLSHYNLLLGQTFLDLYDGEALRAHRRLNQQWPSLERSHLLKIAVVRIQALQLRANVACVVADIMLTRDDHSEAARLMADAARCADKLRRERVARCEPCADLIAASVALSQNQQRNAVSLLNRAAATFDEQGLAMMAAASRVRLGEMIGDADGETTLNAGIEAFAKEGVQQPRRMVDVLAPGFQYRG